MALIKPKQLEFMDWEFGVFFHFGIRTFNEGHRDWDGKPMDLDTFCPEDLDCGEWIRTAAAAGAKYAVLVCKHHDGFANWPSRYTGYSVANTPWMNGKGDVVRLFTDACRQYGLKIGLYYSPAQFGSRERRPEEYDDYFIAQIRELLCNYGAIDYLWFDGCGSEGHVYDRQRIIAAIRECQKEILIFNLWDPDTRWVGNEAGLAHSPNRLTVSALDFSVNTDIRDLLEEPRFLPAECDCRMRLENWFYSDRDEDTVKTVDELMGIYFYSVGRGANLLLNIGPDRRGRLPERDRDTLLRFGERVRALYAHPAEAEETQRGNEVTLRFAPQPVNLLVLSEEIGPEEVLSFSVTAKPVPQGMPVTVYRGTTIGHKALCAFPTVRTEELCVRLDRGDKKVCASLYYSPVYGE